MRGADAETSLAGTGEIKSGSGTLHRSLPLTNAGGKENNKSGLKRERYVATVKLERESHSRSRATALILSRNSSSLTQYSNCREKRKKVEQLADPILKKVEKKTCLQLPSQSK